MEKGDKTVREFKDTVIVSQWLKRNNKPLKTLTRYYKQDSLGHLYEWDNISGPLYNNYKVLDGKVIKDNVNDLFYDSVGRVIKIKTSDTTWLGTRCWNKSVWEFSYEGDSIVKTYYYMYSASPEFKFHESWTTKYLIGNSFTFETVDSFNYQTNRRIKSRETSYLVHKTEFGYKLVITNMNPEIQDFVIIEFLK